jgi:hypothetical protein
MRDLPQYDISRLAESQDLVETVFRFETPRQLPFTFFRTEDDFDPEASKFVDAHTVERQMTAWGGWERKLDDYLAGMRWSATQDYSRFIPPPVIPLECPQETVLTPFGVAYERVGDSQIRILHKVIVSDLESDIPRLRDVRDGFLKRGLLPELFERVEYFLEETGRTIPVSLPDYQSPLGLASKLMDSSEFMVALLEQPEQMATLLDFIADVILDVVGEMERIAGDPALVRSPYLQPRGARGAIWDDFVSVISPDAYREVAVAANDKVLVALGKGNVHTCGPCMGPIAEAIMANTGMLSFDVLFAAPDRTRLTSHLLELKEQCRGRAVLNVSGMPFDLENFTVDFVRRMNDGGGVLFNCCCGSDRQLREWMGVIEQAAE